MKLDRRALLRALGGTTIGASLPWWGTRAAHAASGGIPLRVLFIAAAGGVRRGTWEPNLPGPEYLTQNAVVEAPNWSLRGALTELQPYKSRMTMFQNLDMVSTRADPTSPANAHDKGWTHFLVADDRLTGDLGGSVSIDQKFAQEFNRSGPVTRLPSLNVEINESATAVYNETSLGGSYSASGQQVPLLKWPPAIWDQVFPAPLNQDVAEQARAQARRTALYDFVRSDYTQLAARLPAGDRIKVEQMLQLRSDIQASYGVVNSRDALRPSRPFLFDPWETVDFSRSGSTGNPRWRANAEVISKLVAAAFHTDTTRVASVNIHRPPSYEFGFSDGQYGASDWHDLDHKVSGDDPSLTNGAAAATIDRMQKDTYSVIRFLVDELASLQESDGSSLLDHTLVVITSHISEGSHDISRLPWTVIGDAQGGLRTGRFIRFPVTRNDNNQVGVPENYSHRIFTYSGRAHNDLFLTLLQAAGIQATSFGRSNIPEVKGVIQEMLP
jgi:hypothetical protein